MDDMSDTSKYCCSRCGVEEIVPFKHESELKIEKVYIKNQAVWLCELCKTKINFDLKFHV